MEGFLKLCLSPHLPLALEVRAQDWGPRSLHKSFENSRPSTGRRVHSPGLQMSQSPVASRPSPVVGGVFRAGTHPTGRRLSRLRRLRGLKESRMLALSTRPWSGEPARTPPGTGRGACAGCMFRGQWSPQSTLPRLTFLGGHAADFWPPPLELPGPTGQTEEYKRGWPHFWLVWSFLVSVPGGK